MQKMKKVLSLVLALSMVLSYVPVPALAEEVCEHHEHDQSLCGYVAEVKGSPCLHRCGEDCETQLAEDGETTLCLSHVCPEGDCGYVAKVEGSPCVYECADCAAAQTPVCTGEADCPVSEHSDDCAKKLADDQAAAEAAKAAADQAAADAVAALLNALPSLEEIREMDQAGQDEANLLVQEAYNAYRNLTEEQQALLSDAPAALQAYFDFFSAPPALAAEIHSHRICGNSCSHSHAAVEWTALPVLFDALTGGYYYLENSRTIIDAIQIKGDVFLCLNGNTLTQSDAFNAITVSGSGTLTICDCGGTGVITNTKTGDAGSSCIYVSDRGSLTVYGGKIAGAQFEAIAFDSTGSLEIHGGTVTGAADAVTVRSANDITVTGGSITASVGSGISCDNASFRNLTVSGGYIEGKACGVELGTVTCTGKVEISGGTLYGKGPVPNTTTYAKDYYGLSYVSGAANSCRINITGGTVYGARGGVYNNNPSASITVSGGTVGSGSQKEAGIKLSKGELRIENGKVYGLSSEGTSTATVTGGQLQYAWLTGTAPQALRVYGGTIGRVDGSTSAYGINAALVTTSSTCGIQIYGGTIVGTDHAVRNNSVHSYQISGGTLSGGKADLFWNMAPDSPSQAYLSLKDYSGEPLSVELGLSVAVGSYIARDVFRSGLITLTGSDYEATYDATGKTVRLAEKANCDAGHDFNTNHVCTRCGAIGGTCGENLVWTFDEPTSTITISGVGYMEDNNISINDTPWLSFADKILSVVIEEGVNGIGAYVFRDCTALRNVVLPDSLTLIEWGAFSGCINLSSVEIPANVTTIEASAFQSCKALTSVSIPSSVTYIDADTFAGCDNLLGIWVDTENTKYSNDSYGVLFNKNKTILVKYPEGRNGSYVIPSGVTTIALDAFMGSQNLTAVTISDTVTDISSSAFIGCNLLKNITIPSSVTRIGGLAFACCNSLKSISFQGDAPALDDSVFAEITATAYYPYDNATWTADKRQNYGGTLTWVPDSCKNGHTTAVDAAVAVGCTTAGKTEGSHCSVCDTVLVEQTVIPAQHDTKPSICSVCRVYGTCGANVTWTFDEETGTLNVTGSGPMANYAVNYSSGPWYPHMANLKKVVIGEGITTVGKNNFYDCQYLEEVQLPTTITTISSYAFDDCYALKKINLPEGITAIGYCAFSNCRSLESVELPKTLTSIGARAFEYCSSLKEIKIPNGVTTIGDETFRYCTAATKVVIPRSVTSIGDYAFAGCTGLTEVTIPKNVTYIGERAFAFDTTYYKSSLEKITFMGGFPTMGYAAQPLIFYHVTATVYYPQDNATWTTDKRQNYGGTLNWVAKAINADDYGLTVAGVKVTDEALSGTGWSYDPDENVLYLNTDFKSSVTHKAEKLEIVVDGTVSCGNITSDGSLTIRGKTGRSADSLSVSGRLNTGGPDLKIENLSVTVSFDAGNKGDDSAIVTGVYYDSYGVKVASGCLTVTDATLRGICSGNSACYGIYTGTLVVQGNSYVYGRTSRSLPGIYANQNGSSFSSSCHVEASSTGTAFRVQQTNMPTYGYFYNSTVTGPSLNYARKLSSEVFSSTGYGSSQSFAFVGEDHASYRQDSDGTTHSLYCDCKTYSMGPAVDCSGGTATCAKKAVCDVCKEEYGSKLTHSFTKQDTDPKYQAPLPVPPKQPITTAAPPAVKPEPLPSPPATS